jgi:site-specific DNA-cytosine methylase
MQVDSVSGTLSAAPVGVSSTTVATPDVFGTDFGTVLLACFFSGIGNVATAAARLGNFLSGFPMAKVSSHCEIQPRLLSMLRDRHPGSFCFGDINNVLDHSAVLVACNAAIALFAFNCEPYSIQGNAKGDKDPRADSIIWIFDYATRFKPKIIVLENVKGFLIWRCAGKHHPEDGSITGPAFENLSLRLQRAGYHFQWVCTLGSSKWGILGHVYS